MATVLPLVDSQYCWFSVGRNIHALVDVESLPLLAPHRWRIVNSYAATGNGQTEPMVYMHRLLSHCPQDMVVDHINGNKLDNRKCNLRLCTDLENRLNTKSREGAKSKYKGVFVRVIPANGINAARIKFDVSIRRGAKKAHIGTFDCEVKAAKAYDLAAKELHGEFAFLNFPTEATNEICSGDQKASGQRPVDA
jgi:hypothetical protein